MPLPDLPPTFSDPSPVGNWLAVKRDPLAFYARLAREAGPFAYFALPSGNVLYFVNDPALINEVLITQADRFVKWNFNGSFAQVFGQGLLASEEGLHRRMKSVVRPAFQSHRAENYAEQMAAIIGERLAGWQEGEINLTREMTALTLEIVTRCFFSVGPEAGEVEAVAAAMETVQRVSSRLGTAAGDDRAFAAANETLRGIVRGLLTRHDGGDDLITLLAAAAQQDPATVTRAQMEEELRSILLAGYLTTSTALACACWLLARHPGAAGALRAGVEAALHGRAPGFADLPALAGCEAVFLETLRLYPPVWGFGREATGELSLGGHMLPAGARVVICPWLLHRDPARFPDPECFRPERWAGGGLRAGLPRGSFVPFSLGARSCLGERFATMEATLALAAVAQGWKFSEVPGRPDPRWLPQMLLWTPLGVTLRANRLPPP